MPRVGRTILPYYPHHIIQRGHNRQVVFAEVRIHSHKAELADSAKRAPRDRVAPHVPPSISIWAGNGLLLQ